MPEAVIHPTIEELTAFGLGKLPERAAAAIAAHLESCPACRQAVAGVSADSFLDKVRAARQDNASFPPSLAQPPSAPSSAGRPAVSIVPCPNVPPELARHPKYLILRELGRGGMGVVYQARQTVMNRQVVIKVVNPALVDRPDSLERFRREIQAAAQLSHPNIVTAYDAEQVGGLHMLVMEFVPGRSLADVVHLKGALPISVACYFARQVALGLQHAYERGMVHRDIKPQNLMMTPQGQVKILDFGLAKVIREHVTGKGLTSTDAYMGTPEYCAPEQAKDASKADIRADLYSLGCTLYCLLAGNPPFREDTWMNTALAHIQKPPQPLPELRPEVPAELWQVVARLLAKVPAQRYEKPIEVAQALFPFTKSATKRDVKNILAPGPDASSPRRGTMIAADTGEIKRILREVPGKTPPKAVPAKDEAASPFAEMTDTGSASKNIVRVSEPAKPYLAAWWKRPGVQAVAVGVSLALILMAIIIIKVKVQTPNDDTGKVVSSKVGTGKPKPPPAEATVVLEIDQPGAEVSVDGQRQNIEVNIPGDNEPFKIKVEPGRPHKLRISKAGFEAKTQDIELKTGESKSIRIRLEPEPPKPGDKGDKKWIHEVASLPAEAQAKAVAAKLKERNPGFDGTVKPTCENGVVTGLQFVTDHVTDLKPLRALPQLKSLRCWGNAPFKGILLDLSPLEGIPLEHLNCINNPVNADLSPLRGMPLKELHIWGWRGRDLSPLKGMSLIQLNCGGGGMVEDLSSLVDMPLRFLCVNSTKVSDLSPLKGMRLNVLMANHTRVSDLWLLKDMPLRVLFIAGSQVTDLTPIRELPLTELICDFQPERDTETLRSIKTLVKINGKPVAQFWKEVDDKKKDEEKWIREVRALPAEQQVEKVVAKLKERNPGFEGWKEPPTIENGVVTGLEFVTDHMTDISPLRALTGLKRLSCAGSGYDNAGTKIEFRGKLADLSPLKGMHLTELYCHWNSQISDLSPLMGMPLRILDCAHTQISDLSPLKGMSLAELYCGGTKVSDLSPVKGMPLTKLGCAMTRVSDLSPLKGAKLTLLNCWDTAIVDLSPLKGMPLAELHCQRSRVMDLSPLSGMPLKTLDCDFRPERDTKILRSVKTLETINGKPVAELLRPADGFLPLFNGKDKTGWKTQPEWEGGWRVENGILIWSSLDSSFLWTERDDYRDFHLRVETRISDRQYAQLIVRDPFSQSSEVHSGYRIVLNSTNGNPSKTGSLVGLGKGQGDIDILKSPVPPDQWFTLEVIAQGNRVVVKVNGRTTADYPDPKQRFGRGHITLLATNQVRERMRRLEFRRIEIKELPAVKSEVPPAAKPEVRSRAKQLEDLIAAGSVWKGTITYRKGAWVGATVAYEIHIRESDGKKFKGLRFDKRSNRGDVEGEVKGETITWRENIHGADVLITVEGKLTGDTIHVTFNRSYGNGLRVEGDGKLKREGP